MTVDKPWPSALAYVSAMEHPESALRDPQLRAARLRTGRTGRPEAIEGQTAVVFVADTDHGTTVIRCLKRALAHGAERYQYLSGFLSQYPIPVLASASWESDGITVDGDAWPVITMDHVDGVRLDRFIELHIDNSDLLRTVAENWRSTAADLSTGMIAHGDIQPGNILLTPEGRPRLIDLDSIWTPALSDLAPDKPANRNFQHPEAVGTRFWGRYADAFPALVVYVSLRALAVDPSLLAYHTSENLIFTAADFQRPGETALWTSLTLSRDPELSRLTELLAGFCRASVNARTDLDSILRNSSIPGVPRGPAYPPGGTSSSPWLISDAAQPGRDTTRAEAAPPPGLPLYPPGLPEVEAPTAADAPGGLFDPVPAATAPEVFATTPRPVAAVPATSEASAADPAVRPTSPWAAPAWASPAWAPAPPAPASTSPVSAPPDDARDTPVPVEPVTAVPVTAVPAPRAPATPATVPIPAAPDPVTSDPMTSAYPEILAEPSLRETRPFPRADHIDAYASRPVVELPEPVQPPRRLDRRVVLGAAVAAVVAGGVGLGWAELRGRGGSSGPATVAARPGTALWQVAVPQNVKFTPTDTGQGLLIVEGDDMVGIRVADGSTAWHIAGVSHHVAVANGLMYMQQGVDGGQRLATLRPSDGTVISSVPLAHSVLSLTVVGNTAYYLGAASSAATAATVLQAVDVRSGHVLWTVTKPFSLVNLPIVDGSAVYVGGVGVIWAMSLTGGATRWSAKLPNTPKPSVRAVANGMIIARGIDGTYAVDPAGGTVMWKLIALDAPFLRSAAGVGTGVIYTSAYGTPAKPGYVRSVRIIDGAPLWRSDPTTTTTFATAHQSTVYVSENRTIAALDEQTGRTLWQYRLNGDCVVEPIGVGNVIIVPTENGSLHAIHTAGG